VRFGTRFHFTATRTAALLLGAACAPGPFLLEQVPPRASSFALGDSGEVVRRVQQVFSCSTPPNLLPYATLGWHRDTTFVDVTLMQDLIPVGPNGEPSRICWKGFRVDAEGRIFTLRVQDWPYTAFEKRGRAGTRLALRN
jgi:hypothetical protein